MYFLKRLVAVQLDCIFAGILASPLFFIFIMLYTNFYFTMVDNLYLFMLIWLVWIITYFIILEPVQKASIFV
jgi:hypothetical protein